LDAAPEIEARLSAVYLMQLSQQIAEVPKTESASPGMPQMGM
jgi:hypothetical protein